MSTKIRHISGFIDKWAPNSSKMEYDNTGLLIGNADDNAKSILTCLDVTEEVVKEAASLKANVIVAHHPLIFGSLKNVTEQSAVGKLIRLIIKHDINVIAAHTNLDAARNGVSFLLAKKLGLEKIGYLQPVKDSLRLFVLRIPIKVKASVVDLFGSLNIPEVGWSLEDQNIAVGRFYYDVHHLKTLQGQLDRVLDGSPFSIDPLHVDGESFLTGFGAVGELSSSMSSDSFINHVAETLGSEALRYSGNAAEIRKVAVCGGSGASLIGKAFGMGCDAYVTADIKYHEYFIPNGKLLIDAGHYETEAPVIDLMTHELSEAFPGVNVVSTRVNTNPLRGFQKPEFNTKTIT